MPYPVSSSRLNDPSLRARIWPAHSTAGKATRALSFCMARATDLSCITWLTCGLFLTLCSAARRLRSDQADVPDWHRGVDAL
eukprot:2770279-Pyramimonas_sp.AAC.1